MLTFMKDPGGHGAGYVKDPGIGWDRLNMNLDPGTGVGLKSPGGGGWDKKENKLDPGTGV
ncbi:hypothetical protein [Bacillus mycoides]|uniref:hypothetical protein n=1 Tax=Bacillus mycoides TaxID=1405 RepID=UPI00119DE207|nr:hypothetical protein [Bacillus mycoides]